MGKTILIVEYDHDTRIRYRKILESEQFSVITVTNGKDGLSFLASNTESVALIILCLRMPLMDGNEFLKLIAEEAHLKKIPSLTIAIDPDEVQNPTTVVVQKPISDTDLKQLVTQILQGRGMNSEGRLI